MDTYSSRAALQLAGDTAVDLDAAYLTAPNDEGAFVFSTADLSAEVTADAGGRNYIAPQSDPSGLSGAWVRQSAAAIAFDAGMFGAVIRDGQDKLRDLVSVKDFGITGSPTINERAALNTAMAAATQLNRPLDLMGLTINATGGALAANCSIEGRGATIKGRFDSQPSNVVWRNFTVEADVATGGAIYLHGSPTARCRNVILDNVSTAFGTGATVNSRLGINATHVDDLHVRGGTVRYGAQLSNCTNYNFSQTTFDGDNFQNAAELLHASARSHGIVSGCHFLNSGDNWIDLYSSGERTVITGCRFIGCKPFLGTGIEIKVSITDNPNNSSGGALGWSEQIIISNNYFGSYVSYGVAFESYISCYYIDTRSDPVFLWENAPRNLIVANNIFDGFDATNQQSGAIFVGISLGTTVAATLTGNIFRNMAIGAASSEWSSCIWLSDCRDIIVANNHGAMKNGCGLSFHGTNDSVTVSGNHFLDDLNGGFSNKYGIAAQKVGSEPEPVLRNSIFLGNTINGTAESGRFPYYANGAIERCTFNANNFIGRFFVGQFSKLVVTDNIFASSTNYCASFGGVASVTSSFASIRGNQCHATGAIPGMLLTKVRASIVDGNFSHGGTEGMWFFGSNTDGELNYNTVENNYTVGQSGANFPRYTDMTANDSATLQAANNRKLSS